MRQRQPGEDRDFREDMDEMGDDEQSYEIALTERYVQDPPDDHVIEEPENLPPDGLGITRYEQETARPGDDDDQLGSDAPAEADAVNPTNRP
ncbi:hypothetical protein [Actinomadura fibrosa]|uniref:DUF5709 domain-containing protein n=1 Tax=Actinomadura fibrosa TaxID=111802 RepID=A0ABW2XQD6_9ACTN|nr:hypothetical protein [Actinomadura fibrosa]